MSLEEKIQKFYEEQKLSHDKKMKMISDLIAEMKTRRFPEDLQVVYAESSITFIKGYISLYVSSLEGNGMFQVGKTVRKTSTSNGTEDTFENIDTSKDLRRALDFFDLYLKYQ